MEQIRAEHPVFRSDADVSVLDTGSDQVLGISRSYGEERLIALFNFSEYPQTAELSAAKGYDLVSGEEMYGEAVSLPGYGFAWIIGD